MKPGLRAVIFIAVSTPEQAADEKQSLDTQERELTALADSFGWPVIDILRIPGFSRDYISFEECIADMLRARPPITAMSDLRAHIDRRDFDVLMVRDADRFGRTQSLIMQIAETVCIRLNLAIYSQMDGQLIEGLAGRWWAAMVGLRSAGDQDKRKKYFRDGRLRNAAAGKQVSSHVVQTHVAERDKRGKVVKLIVNEERRRLFHDLAEALLEGIPWMSIPFVLRDRYGHLSPSTGRIWDKRILWRTLYTPVCWGHNAVNFVHTPGVWAFDESAPVPEGVTIFRNTHEPMYTGELAERLKSELKRRAELFVGRTTHGRTNAFSGLIVCAVCGCRMGYMAKPGRDWRAYYCHSNDRRYEDRPRHACDTLPRYILYDDVRVWVDAFLRALLEDENPLSFQRPPDNNRRVESIVGEIAAVERRIAALLLQRADTPAASLSILTELIQQEDSRLTALRGALAQERQHVARAARAQAASAVSLDELITAGLTDFWQRPPDSINRILYGIFGDFKLWVRDGVIVDFRPR